MGTTIVDIVMESPIAGHFSTAITDDTVGGSEVKTISAQQTQSLDKIGVGKPIKAIMGLQTESDTYNFYGAIVNGEQLRAVFPVYVQGYNPGVPPKLPDGGIIVKTGDKIVIYQKASQSGGIVQIYCYYADSKRGSHYDVYAKDVSTGSAASITNAFSTSQILSDRDPNRMLKQVMVLSRQPIFYASIVTNIVSKLIAGVSTIRDTAVWQEINFKVTDDADFQAYPLAS